MNFTNMIWQGLMQNILDNGKTVKPRGLETKEILGCRTVIPMDYPVVTIKNRKLGYKFMAAEAAWILSGDNRVATIEPYAKAIKQFSDDGTLLLWGLRTSDTRSNKSRDQRACPRC
jgi:hypothetical protein